MRNILEIKMNPSNKFPKKKKNTEDSYFCEVCDKEFKSEQQMKNHNTSKIHKSNLKELI